MLGYITQSRGAHFPPLWGENAKMSDIFPPSQRGVGGKYRVIFPPYPKGVGGKFSPFSPHHGGKIRKILEKFPPIRGENADFPLEIGI